MTSIDRIKLTQSLSSVSEMAEQEIMWMIKAITNESRASVLFKQRIELNKKAYIKLQDWIDRRKQHEPLAYIIGFQPFYGLDIKVNQHTLIPRSSTECMVEWLLQTFSKNPRIVADLGTGSGAIAAALAHHRPLWEIVASDISEQALTVAKKNLAAYTNVSLTTSNWLAQYQRKFDLIIANPPYIDPKNAVQNDPSLQHEPKSALYSDENGFKDLFIIIQTAKHYLKPNGQLVLEHGSDQANVLIEYLKQNHYININDHQDNSNHPRWVSASNKR